MTLCMERDLTAIAAFTSQASYRNLSKRFLRNGRVLAAAGGSQFRVKITANPLANGKSNSGHGEKRTQKPYATNHCCTSKGAFAKCQQSRHGFAGNQSKLCGTLSKTDFSVKRGGWTVMYPSVCKFWSQRRDDPGRRRSTDIGSLSVWRVASRPHAAIKSLCFATGAGERGLALAFGRVPIKVVCACAPPVVHLRWAGVNASRQKHRCGKNHDLHTPLPLHDRKMTSKSFFDVPPSTSGTSFQLPFNGDRNIRRRLRSGNLVRSLALLTGCVNPPEIRNAIDKPVEIRRVFQSRPPQFWSIFTAASCRTKPGGRPCLERISNQPSREPTTLILIPGPMLVISAEFSLGPL